MTAKELTPTPSKAQGSAQTIEVRAPEPGSYWRLKADFEGQHTRRCDANPMDKGTVLLLKDIQHADGQAHAYTLAPHPGWPEGAQTDAAFHADDFHDWWEPEWDAETVRERELMGLNKEMEKTKMAMLEPPPEPKPVAHLGHTPSKDVQGEGRALATTDSIAAMTAYADQLKENAEQRSQWIQTHSKTLSGQGATMARYHAERAQAALARANAQLKGVESLLKTAENLRLYTGEGVTVYPLRDGKPAAPDARVTVYQELLAFDEETLILLDHGGMDHRHVDELITALADPALVERMIPSKRGVVLCRFRGSYKEFFPGGDAAAALANAGMNAQAQQTMLLVRDGERVTLIDAPEVLGNMKQLLPSKGEQSSYFRDEVTKDDLAYADAQARQLANLDRYGKTLIVLWGLRDRDELFAGSALPRFASWLDPAFQNAYMELVSLDTMLRDDRPHFADWRKAQNAHLVAGAWVAVNIQQTMAHDWLPAAFASTPNINGDFFQTRRANLPEGEVVHIGRAKSNERGLYIEVPLIDSSWRDPGAGETCLQALCCGRTQRRPRPTGRQCRAYPCG